MTAYVIARMQVQDPEMYDRYKAQTPALVAAHGGEFIVRGGRFEMLEGSADSAALNRTVVIRFPSYAQAEGFYNAPEYRQIVDLRKNAARCEVLIVEGV